MKQSSDKVLIVLLTVFAVLIIGGAFIAIRLALTHPKATQQGVIKQEPTNPKPLPTQPSPAEDSQYTDCDAGLGLNTDTETPEGRGTFQGEELWFVIAMSTTSRAEAEQYCAKITDWGGDPGPLYTVDYSGHYEGLEPEYWVVLTAYSTKARAEEGVEVMDQNGVKTYAKKATKLCDSIIYLNDYYY